MPHNGFPETHVNRCPVTLIDIFKMDFRSFEERDFELWPGVAEHGEPLIHEGDGFTVIVDMVAGDHNSAVVVSYIKDTGEWWNWPTDPTPVDGD